MVNELVSPYKQKPGAITNVCMGFRSTTHTYSLAISAASDAECTQNVLLSADQSVNTLTFRNLPLGNHKTEL